MSQDNKFRPYANKNDAADPDAKTRRIDPAEIRKEPAQNDDWRGMVGGSTGNFRADRASRSTTSRRVAGFAPQQQRALSWVQSGGWKWLALGAFVLVVLLIASLALNSNEGRTDTAAATTIPSGINPNNTGRPATAIVIGTQAPAQDPNNPNQSAPPQNAPTGQILSVSGTGTEGLFLREVPSGTVLKTLPEGTQVEKLDQQTDLNGTTWFKVREVGSTLEGWSSSQFLAPVQ